MHNSMRHTAFSLLGVFRVIGKAEEINENRRTHTALSLRIKGNSRFRLENEELSVSDGSILYLPAGVDYHRKTYTEEELIVIHLRAYGYTEKKLQAIGACIRLRPLFETMYQEWESGSEYRYTRCMKLLYEILEAIEKTEMRGNTAVPKTIALGAELLAECFRDPELTISALAEKCHISETYFRKIYKAHYGISPMQALLELRFDYSKSLLASGYYQVKEISALSGFSDVKYFRAAFKRRFGVTPNQYANRSEFFI